MSVKVAPATVIGGGSVVVVVLSVELKRRMKCSQISNCMSDAHVVVLVVDVVRSRSQARVLTSSPCGYLMFQLCVITPTSQPS